MRETILGNHIRKVPSVAVGCMRLSEKSKDEMNHFIHAALEQGAYFFDHADIYGGGMSAVSYTHLYPDHHGSEHRYMRDCTAFVNRRKQKRQESINHPHQLQSVRYSNRTCSILYRTLCC